MLCMSISSSEGRQAPRIGDGGARRRLGCLIVCGQDLTHAAVAQMPVLSAHEAGLRLHAGMLIDRWSEVVRTPRSPRLLSYRCCQSGSPRHR
jgi:hypothetical protein